tara:strand:- start:8743 stop:8886 length:144 start_codon:yes stop_codon:yes gene_type:complete
MFKLIIKLYKARKEYLWELERREFLFLCGLPLDYEQEETKNIWETPE